MVHQPGLASYIRFWGDEAGRWRRDGTHEALIKYFPPRHSVTRIWNKPFLRVSSQGVAGSGVSSEIEHWIDLTQPGFKAVFGFTPQAHQYTFDFGIDRKLTAVATPAMSEGVETITVNLTISFAGGGVTLAQASYVETYERRPDESGFTMRNRSGNPDLTDREYEDLLDFDLGPTDEQLLVYTLPGLERIARGDDAPAREWLHQMLSRCKDTPEKRSLLALLAGR